MSGRNSMFDSATWATWAAAAGTTHVPLTSDEAEQATRPGRAAATGAEGKKSEWRSEVSAGAHRGVNQLHPRSEKIERRGRARTDLQPDEAKEVRRLGLVDDHGRQARQRAVHDPAQLRHDEGGPDEREDDLDRRLCEDKRGSVYRARKREGRWRRAGRTCRFDEEREQAEDARRSRDDERPKVVVVVGRRQAARAGVRTDAREGGA